ncbi:hypothetical protein SLITO_v1c06470 [Spiroplasma litorale]|uniref:Uncharacterized protein n=1 Tax=Spiroplasma litorale TaxID=216942 RepID=A0A0K1W281_9MOLU|nr:hypothetical protein [Spiroplasma litorale]AKX34276.1 hypothetical protein SLITO_v1c06470 [Spiroplasma litorale]
MKNKQIFRKVKINNIIDLHTIYENFRVINLNVFTQKDIDLYYYLVNENKFNIKIDVIDEIVVKDNGLVIGLVLHLIDKNDIARLNSSNIFLKFNYLYLDVESDNLYNHFTKILEEVILKIPYLMVKEGYKKLSLETMMKNKSYFLPTEDQKTLLYSLVYYKWSYDSLSSSIEK